VHCGGGSCGPRGALPLWGVARTSRGIGSERQTAVFFSSHQFRGAGNGTAYPESPPGSTGWRALESVKVQDGPCRLATHPTHPMGRPRRTRVCHSHNTRHQWRVSPGSEGETLDTATNENERRARGSSTSREVSARGGIRRVRRWVVMKGGAEPVWSADLRRKSRWRGLEKEGLEGGVPPGRYAKSHPTPHRPSSDRTRPSQRRRSSRHHPARSPSSLPRAAALVGQKVVCASAHAALFGVQEAFERTRGY